MNIIFQSQNRFHFAVNLELINSLWVPNIFIYNLKTFRVIDVLSKLAGLWIDRRKRIYYRCRLTLVIGCILKHRKGAKLP